MNTNIQLTAEQIAEACADFDGIGNRQVIEDAFERQTPPEVFKAALRRADMWPRCRNTPEGLYGLQYAYLLEFLICDEVEQRRLCALHSGKGTESIKRRIWRLIGGA